MDDCKKEFNEDWSRWEPVAGARGNYYVEDIFYGNDDLKLVLRSETKDHFVELVFPYTIAATRIAEEGSVFMLFDKLYAKYGKEFYAPWAFFKVQNSDCLKWVSEGSAGILDDMGLIHYVIKGIDIVLDIVTNNPPLVKIFDNYDKNKESIAH